LAELLAAAGERADRVTQTRSEPWAIRYLAAGRPTSVLPPAPLNPADGLKLANLLADRIDEVITAVLKGLDLSEAEYRRALDLTVKELRAAATNGWEPL
jgi:hypothetical protein